MCVHMCTCICMHKIFVTSVIYIWTPDTKFSDPYPMYSQKYAYMLHTRYRPRQEIWQMGLYWPMHFDSVL